MNRRFASLIVASIAALGLAALLAASVQAAAPAWRITVASLPTNLAPNSVAPPVGQSLPNQGYPQYSIQVTNVGSAPTSGAWTVTDTLPAGLTEAGTGQQTVTLTAADALTGGGGTAFYSVLSPGETVPLNVPLAVGPLAEGSTVTNHVEVSGGGAAATALDQQSTISSDPAAFDFLATRGLFVADADNNSATQAGSHPDHLVFDFGFPAITTGFQPGSGEVTGVEGGARDLRVTLPKGMVVDPSATPVRCTEAQLEDLNQSCPDSSQVGSVTVFTATGGNDDVLANVNSLYNMVPPAGVAAEFAFDVSNVGVNVHIDGGLSDGEYRLTANANDILERIATPVLGVQTTLWGDPSGPGHDHTRGLCIFNSGDDPQVCPVPPQSKPFLTMPSLCQSSIGIDASADSWVNPDQTHSLHLPAKDLNGNVAPVTGCNAVAFDPTLQARPTTGAADSPSGLDVDLHVPQANDLSQLATAHLRKAVVTLPQGLVLNPSSANGLDSCSPAQIGIDPGTGVADGNQPSCPDASRIGDVEVDTPLLDHPLPGSVYVATPHNNPFDSLLAIYVTVDDPATGVLIKLAGEVSADPNTGQLTATFDDNPQLPFSDFKLSFFGGSYGVLRTPPTCGAYSTTSQMTPWSAPDSGPPATPHDDYSISQGPNGSCANTPAQEPNAPSFDAGAVNPLAGTYSPFVMHLSRSDGSQQFASLTLTPPPGLLGRLAGTPACSDAALDAAKAKTGAQEKANPSCPAASQLGTVTVGAGAGPSPYYTTGKAYLAGPYKGAPLSIAIITPATAGPYDLGTVVVRTALKLDPTTAQITATSDPIPQILQGIPLDVRSIVLNLDKPNFTLNGTSCDETAVTGSLLSALGQSASLSERFQLGECGNLGFKPKLTLALKGGTKRNGHPALTSVLTPRSGDANLAKAAVTLPGSMQLDQSHIQAPCTRPQFAANQCPAASIVGSVTATSPLVDYTLTGPVYLRTGNNPLPDIVLALHGPASQPIEIDQVGKIDTVNARLRTTFETIPDAPITRAVISLAGGSKGLLVNNTSLCAQTNKASVLLDGQNGKTADSAPKVGVKCPKAHKHKKRHHKRHKRHHARHGGR